ncbi:hypothetical protein EC973_008483 [Apophysomyces ossiformis]|uniref:Uncharacterized protein n=1 Tax=Apophysomyces ossiformis TaxID=679940 RepID=A0A8H7EQ97_9FUNG|nr:hypothetical protein EC973_008483 [Apophysomyces ossiformis]
MTILSASQATEEGKKVKAIEKKLSKNNVGNAVDIDSLHNYRKIGTENRDILRKFYSEKKSVKKSKRTQYIYTQKAYATVASNERNFLNGSGKKTNVLLMMIGSVGTGVCSPIRGHCRRGGKQLREQHLQQTSVGMTNEFRSSQLCPYCYQVLSHLNKKKDGYIKKNFGTVICTNSECISVKKGYGSRGRDQNAALNIAVAGTSALFSERHEPFQEFNPKKASKYLLDNNLLASLMSIPEGCGVGACA